MSRPDEQDDFARQRLAAMGLSHPGWMPDQPDDARPRPDEPNAPVASARPAALPRVDLAGRLRAIDLTASGRALLGLAAACACLLVVTAWALLRPRPVAPLTPLPPTASAMALPTPTPAGLVVDVGGRVRRPGLVTLPAGARVADAVKAAGGALRARDLMQVNLAAKVTDGQLLLIGMPGAGAADPAAASGPAAPVNLNSATTDQLDALPGIGPVLAQRIVDWRTANGGFTTVRDLDQVSGIGDAIFAELEPLVTV